MGEEARPVVDGRASADGSQPQSSYAMEGLLALGQIVGAGRGRTTHAEVHVTRVIHAVAETGMGLQLHAVRHGDDACADVIGGGCRPRVRIGDGKEPVARRRVDRFAVQRRIRQSRAFRRLDPEHFLEE